MSLVFGVGIHNSDAPVKLTESGKVLWRCPYYVLWCNMLKRCYHQTTQNKFPTYQGVTVVTEWLTYSEFVTWLKQQPQHDSWLKNGDFTLDKDLIQGASKVYSPATCALIPQWLNKLLTDSKAARGNLPLGVSKHGKNYRARVSQDGESLYLGTFTTVSMAHAAWQVKKAEIIDQAVTRYLTTGIWDSRVVASLRCVSQKIRKDLELGVETTNYDWREYE